MTSKNELRSLKTTIKTNAVKFQGLDLDGCIKKLIYGCHIKKLTKKGNGKLKKTFYYLYENDLTQLRWLSDKKLFRDAKIDLRTVTTVSETPVSVRKKKVEKYDSDNILSILYGQEQELILVFDNLNDKLDWWCGIEYFIQKTRALFDKSKETLGEIANEIFQRADRDGSKGLTRDEIRKILKELQANVKKKDLNALFDRYDRDQSNTIDDLEFRELINEIFRKKELIGIFKQYCGSNFRDKEYTLPMMSLNQFQEFLEKEQNQHTSIRDLKYLGEKLREANPDDAILSYDDFSGVLFSINNSVFNPKHLDVYQDMNQPLTDYYINSSHNTYLLGNQLTGESSVNAYITAINKGCRCVELDIWPGEKGEPVIYHGHTLTSKILFSDVIKALAEHSFVSSPYPMILSFEMHCDVKIQARITQILHEHLADSIYVITQEEKNRRYFPSPNELKYKFVIKGKGVLKPIGSKLKKGDDVAEAMVSNTFLDFEEETLMNQVKADNIQKMISLSYGYQTRVELHRLQLAEVRMKGPYATTKPSIKKQEKSSFVEIPIDEDEEAHLKEPKLGVKKSLKIDTDKANEVYEKNLGLKKVYSENLPSQLELNKTVSKSGEEGLEPENDEDSGDEAEQLAAKQEFAKHSASGAGVDASGTSPNKDKKEKPLKVNPELNSLYSMIGGKLNMKNRTCWHIVSLSENKINKLIKKDPQSIIETHKQYLTRAYPAGFRIDSSNYDPIPSWNIGSQIVALNFQTADEPMLLTIAKFMGNGGPRSGYILKPEFLTHSSPSNSPITLNSFTSIKKKLTIKVISGQQIRPDDFSTKEIIDPFIEVKIKGHELDEMRNSSQRTHVVQDNGLNPIWADEKHKDDVTFEFNIHAPDLCTVIFYVWDNDKIGKNKLGWYAIDFNNMLTGYRVIPVWNTKNFQTIRFSYIFCHIKIEDRVFRI